MTLARTMSPNYMALSYEEPPICIDMDQVPLVVMSRLKTQLGRLAARIRFQHRHHRRASTHLKASTGITFTSRSGGSGYFVSIRTREPIVELVCLWKPYIGADFPDRELNGSPQHGKRFRAVIHRPQRMRVVRLQIGLLHERAHFSPFATCVIAWRSCSNR